MLLNILSYCLRNPEKGCYASDIAKNLKLNQKTVSNYLNKLEKENLVKSKLEGRNKIFYLKLDDNHKSKAFIHEIEAKKTLQFLSKHFKIKELLAELDIKAPFLIFGSYAKGLETKESDIDIFIAGDYNEKEVRKLSDLYSIEIQVHVMTKKNFKEAARSDNITFKEIIKDHIIIQDYDFFIKIFFGL